jgi:hypothetical protein
MSPHPASPDTISGVVERCELSTEWGSRYSCSAGDAIGLARSASQYQLMPLRL